MGRTPRTIIGLLALATLTLTACGGADDDTAADEPASAEEDAGFGEFEAPAEEPVSDDASGDIARTGGVASSGLPVADFGRDIITEVGLTMATDDIARTAEDVRRITIRNGGAVFSSDVRVGEPLEEGTVPGSGSMTVRIPPADLDRLIADLDGLGGVTRVTQESEDVTDQLVDLEIRIRQAQVGIERIEEILAQTTDLDDLFSVENELTRRQVELERLLAAQRSTEDRVALATLTIELEFRPNAGPEAPPPSDDGIADAFASGWDAFVGALFAIGFVLAVLAPFLATALVVGTVVLLLARRLRRRASRDREPRPLERPPHTDGQPVAEDVSEPVDEPSPSA